ncbi:MAG: hypothetical protein PHR16_08735 [Methylovulum sp.]|nr:hypothetical protein [Methylovulum sp.]
MESYLSIIENNLGYSAIHIATGIIVIVILICLLGVMGSRRKAIKQVAALEKTQADLEQAQTQLSENLQASQEQLQHLENELTAKNHQIEQEKQTAQHQAGRVALLEEQINQRRHKLAEVLDTLAKDFTLEAAVYDSADEEQEDLLWQRHSAALGQLTQRLQTEEQRRKALELSRQTTQTQLAEKEAILGELRQTLDAQTAQIANLEQSINEQQALMQGQLDNSTAELAKLQTKNHAYAATIGKLETGRMQVFNDLNLATQKIHQLESALTNKEKGVEPIKQEPIAPVPTAQEAAVQQTIEQEPVAQKRAPSLPQLEEAAVSQLPQPETAETTQQAAPRFNKLLGTIGLGKKQPVEELSEPATEELPADQPEMAEFTQQTTPQVNKLFGAFGLGKKQPAEDRSEPVTEEPPADQPETAESTQQATPRVNKLLGAIGLGKKQPAEDTETKSDLDTTRQPVSENDETTPANPMPEQLKGFFQKITAFTKK